MEPGQSGRTPALGGASALPSIPGVAESELSATINVTPMIDVMLVLLIIFMVVTPILTQYEATPPSAFTATPEPDDEVITIGIDRDGSFFLENERVVITELAARLDGALARQAFGERIVHLRADRDVSYARILDAVDAAREAGVATIGAITEPFEAETDAEPGR